MKITKKWLKDREACNQSLDYVYNNNYIGLDIIFFLKKLIKEKRLSDANWLVTRYMNKKQNVMYAIFAAEQVLPIFEKKYLNDKRPRKAIKAVRDYLKRPCEKTKDAADAAAYAAYAAYAADVDATAYAAADADATAYAAAYAAYAADADAADAAAAAAAYAAAAYAAYAAYAADADAAADADTAAYAADADAAAAADAAADADTAAYAAAYAAYAADADAADAVKIKILKNGLKILRETK